MEDIAAALVYDILVRAGAARTAGALLNRLPACVNSIPPTAKLQLHEDAVALEAMVRFAADSKLRGTAVRHHSEVQLAADSTSANLIGSTASTTTTVGFSSAGPAVDVAHAPPTCRTSEVTATHASEPVAADANGLLSTAPHDHVAGAPPDDDYRRGGAGWSTAEVSMLLQGLRQHASSMDKNKRFRAIAALVATRSKRECYDKFKQMLDDGAIDANGREIGKPDPGPMPTSHDGNGAASNFDGLSDSYVPTAIASRTSSASSKAPASQPAAASAEAKDQLWEDATTVQQRTAQSWEGADVTGSGTSPRTMKQAPKTGVDDIEEEILEEALHGSIRSAGPDRRAPPTAPGRAGGWGADEGRTRTTAPSAAVAAAKHAFVVEDDAADDGGLAFQTSTVPTSTARVSTQDHSKSSVAATAATTIKFNFPSSGIAASSDLWEDAGAHSSSSSLSSSTGNAIGTRTVTAASDPSLGSRFHSSGSSSYDVIVEEDIEGFDSGGNGASGGFDPSIARRQVGAAAPAPAVSAHSSQQPSKASAGAALADGNDACKQAQALFTSLGVTSGSISPSTAARLRLALHGQLPLDPSSSSTISVQSMRAEWLTQGLVYSDEPGLQYGLLQHKGGPCGPLACVNAAALRWLFYGHPSMFEHETAAAAIEACDAAGSDDAFYKDGAQSLPLDPSPDRRVRSLILGIVDVIWRCRPAPSSNHDAAPPAFVAVYDDTLPRLPPQSLRIDGAAVAMQSDGITERLRVHTCTSKAAVAAVVEANINVLMKSIGPGLVCVLYSAVLTRGVGANNSTGLLSDVDLMASYSGGALIGGFGYASQELVNLMLTGRATSNTFDGERVFEDRSSGGGGDKITLHGVSHRADVGFLSVLHAGGYMEVGSNLLRPKAPVWVVFGESHYCVLFAAPKGCVWPSQPADKKRYTFGRKKSDVFPPHPSRCLGLGALSATFKTPVDIVYWDGLARQDELMRLTVTPSSSLSSLDDDDDVPSAKDVELSSIEMWAWSLWPACKVAWNDTDPWEPLRISDEHMPKYTKWRPVGKY